MLEEEVLSVPITEEASPLLPASPRVSLYLVPLTSKRVYNLAPDVSHDLGNRWGGTSKDLCAARGPNVPSYDAANNLLGYLSLLQSCIQLSHVLWNVL